MVQRIVPMAVLLGSYGAFSLLGRTLFPQEGRMRALFLLLVSALMWAGAYAYGMEGFDLLCSGWRGVSIRGGVLLPWTASLCLRQPPRQTGWYWHCLHSGVWLKEVSTKRSSFRRSARASKPSSRRFPRRYWSST